MEIEVYCTQGGALGDAVSLKDHMFVAQWEFQPKSKHLVMITPLAEENSGTAISLPRNPSMLRDFGATSSFGLRHFGLLQSGRNP